MGLKCAILGHKFEKRSRENNQEQDEDGNSVVLEEVERKVCQRCGKQRDERRSTRVREDESSSTDRSKTDEVRTESPQRDSIETTPETDSYNSTQEYTSGYSTQSYEETANAGIVISSDTDTDTTQDSDNTTTDTTQDSNSSTENMETYRKAESQGAYIASSPEEHTSVVSCEKCGYEQYETQVSRESGDLCHKCGGWISVENAES